MQGCSNGTLIPVLTSADYSYEARGIKNGKCHIQKQQYIFKPQYKKVVVADYYVPLADYNKASSLYLQYANNMCGNTDYRDYNISKAKTLILDYCR